MIDTSGNITLNLASDFIFPIERVSVTGESIDISAANIKLIAKSRFEIVPDIDPTNPKGRLIHLTEAHAAQCRKPVDYILQLSVGGIQSVLMKGTITATGFAV